MFLNIESKCKNRDVRFAGYFNRDIKCKYNIQSPLFVKAVTFLRSQKPCQIHVHAATK